ncbi:unnamed protein product [Trichogramma brassicae]|uniref:Uncharacterized protein n=1 Tax=Trichogramma brassicae TaxID=86971 RepID=A0A6H5I4D3_9HYME|nr:unnamed protein product [Trichogramma brassicae]
MQQRATLEEEHLDGQSQHVARAEEEHEEYRQEDQTTDRVSRLGREAEAFGADAATTGVRRAGSGTRIGARKTRVTYARVKIRGGKDKSRAVQEDGGKEEGTRSDESVLCTSGSAAPHGLGSPATRCARQRKSKVLCAAATPSLKVGETIARAQTISTTTTQNCSIKTIHTFALFQNTGQRGVYTCQVIEQTSADVCQTTNLLKSTETKSKRQLSTSKPRSLPRESFLGKE